MSNDSISNNRRIAKNTLVLYARMLFLMTINLYTSRVILNALGVEDYGIYNVVGGFVMIFSLISSSLSGAASRFLNFEMGTGDKKQLKKVFSSTLTIQYALAIIVLIAAETVGLWFLNNKMAVPNHRMHAANWVFQLSLITFCSNLITVPFNAALIAHERMKTFAYVSIFEGCMKLAIAFSVLFSPIDSLILYAILICILQYSIRTMYRIYCRKHFDECRNYNFELDKTLLLRLFAYSGWGFIGSSSTILKTQGVNVLLNLFFGPIVNASRGVAVQVQHAIGGFVSNFMVAIRPQITQSYASGNTQYTERLLFLGTKLSFYLFLVFDVPLVCFADVILNIWLKEVPEHSIVFVQLTLIFALLDTLSHPAGIVQAATGNIRNYQIVVSGLQLLNVPICYIALKFGCVPESVFIIAIIIEFVSVFIRSYMLRLIFPYDIKSFILMLFNLYVTAMISFLFTIFIRNFVPDMFFFNILSMFIGFAMTIFVIVIIGCNKEERNYVFKFIKRR